MREEFGNLWDFHAAGEWICITTNGIVKADKTLTMGAGCAYEARIRFPGLSKVLGTLVTEKGNVVHVVSFAQLVSFPTKHHWRGDADLELIEKSAKQLVSLLEDQTCPIFGRRIYLGRPGTGAGHLDWKTQVRPLVSQIFDDRVVIVTKRKP